MPDADDPQPQPERRRLVDRALHALATTTHSRWYGPMAGAIAFGLTLTVSAPYTAVLVAALWLTPERWKSLVICSSLGGAFGAVVLISGFQHLGWAAVYAAFPELASSTTWGQVVQAIHDYGVFALGVVAAAPMPQTPALAVAATAHLDPFAVFAALFCGKVLKYGVVAWLVSIGSPVVDRIVGLKPPKV
jgi:hypothetical protein